jgi:signal transduction histidine kinase/DNA-binding NarL/FixJ family response regulator
MPTTQTLLIVDDCREDRQIYRRYLLQDPHQSYRIWQVDSAEEGLVLCQKIQFDALLLDFCLPGMNGLQFLNKLKDEELHAPKAVIVLTGHGDEQVAVQALKWGVQDYLVKQHLKADVLQLTVRNAIEKSHLQAQLNKTLERQRLIATTSLRIRQSLNLEDILHTAVAEIQQLLKCDRVAVYQIEPDFSSHLAAEIAAPVCEIGSAKNLSDIGWQKTMAKSLDWSKKAIANVYAAGLNDSLLEQAENTANLVVPIAPNSNGDSAAKIWGLLVAHQCAGERQWQADEVEMLHEVSVQLAIAIQQAELLNVTQAALAKEKQLSSFKTQIVATVSHEYRTPLASILAAASTLKQHGDKLDESKQEKFLQIIEEKARQMSKLVDDMLLVNKIELDKTKFKPVAIDLLQFFEEQIGEIRSTQSDPHKLSFKVRGNTQGFWGDRGLLRLILDNLISNALKYSPNGSNVEVNLIGKDSRAIFSVKDRGIGIPKEELDNLFQCFYRASNVGTIPGTGLGLAIVKACVDLHGGEINLDTKLEQGTKVTVTLPKKHHF